MTDARIVADPGSGQVCYIDGAAYERLLRANERELWALTEKHARLVHYVQVNLWPRAKMTMGDDLREDVADELYELGCEVVE